MAVLENTLDTFGKPQTKISDPDKSQVSYLVRKCRDGFVFYEIVPSAGSLPKNLQGKWSRQVDAEKAVLNHLKTMTPTPRTQVLKRSEQRAKEKAKEE